MRTILAPGIEWREIDKSDYSPAMTGTNCWIPGFSTKGEPYKPMEFTSRTAWLNYFGEPDNEAERYFYSAICEVLNQNGRLYCCRLPYDNDSFEKMVGFKYEVDIQKNQALSDYMNGDFAPISEEDIEVQDYATIKTTAKPITYDLDKVDEYRTDEDKVPAQTFLIVDTTGGTYGKVTEDSRKGDKREVIGIVPVVTTAANAMYAQSLITLNCLSSIKSYEPLSEDYLKTLYFEKANGTVLSNEGLSATDLVKKINTEGYYQYITTETSSVISVVGTPSYAYPTRAQAQELVETHPEMYNTVSAYDYSRKWAVSALETDIRKYWIPTLSSLPAYERASSTVKTTINTLSSDIITKYLSPQYHCKEDADDQGLPKIKNDLSAAVGSRALSDYLDAIIVDEVVTKGTTTEVDPVRNDFLDEAHATAFKEEIDAEYVRGYTTTVKRYSSIGIYEWDPVYGGLYNPEVYKAISSVNTTIDVPIDPTDTKKYGWHNPDGDDDVPNTLALDAGNYFATIQPAADGNGFDPEHLKDIGVIVYKTYLDPAEGNKVTYEPVEAYCGSLYKDDKDPNTGVTKFIDTIVNSQSNYINFFSNCFSTPTTKKWYLNTCDILISEPSVGGVLGFYSEMTKEDISITKSIYDGLNKGLEKIKDLNKLDVDIICDAGIANIASYLKAIYGDKGQYDLTVTDDLGNSLLSMWKAVDSTNAAVKTWKTVEQKYDNFCKNVRKDCMFIADGLRPLVLQGQKKVIRASKPKNTIDVNILPYLKTISGLNTSYCALYMDWFEMADDYSGDFFWCPPSIKAMGVYINTDVNFNYWDAPAGLNRGRIAATDVAFSPTIQQAGSIYEKCINYAVDYPNDGIVLEGQHTTQVKPSAFDRVNVRRLFCRLERAVYRVSRYFLYEGNTAYTRQRFVDAIDPYFKECKVGGGCYDYKILCSEENNTSETIDRNELHCSIGIKPVKAIEFIMVDFIATSTGADWSEVGL